jgi:hypothetical protein
MLIMLVISSHSTTITYKEFNTLEACNVIKDSTYEIVKMSNEGRVIASCVALNQ